MNRGIVHLPWTNAAQSLFNVTFRLTQSEAIIRFKRSVSSHRILHITRNLPPLVGGMERLNWHIADELSRKAEVRVIGPSGAAARKPASVRLSEAPLKPLPLFFVAALFKALWLALCRRPEVILADRNRTVRLAWIASKACDANGVVYLSGFYIKIDHRWYWSLRLLIFRYLDVHSFA